MQAAIQMFGVHKEAPVVQQKTTGRSLEDGWWWTLVRATGWDSSRNTGPGIGQGLAQPPPAASDSEWHNSHTHLDTAAHCLTTLDTLGHSTLPDHCWTLGETHTGETLGETHTGHLETHTPERHLERHTLHSLHASRTSLPLNMLVEWRFPQTQGYCLTIRVTQ